MASYEIIGNQPLRGKIKPQGAKNEALEVICATLLTDQEVVISNIPNIIDVNRLLDIVRGLGSEVKKIDANTYSFCAKEIDVQYLDSQEFRENSLKIRGSIMLLAPLIVRLRRAKIHKPGGDKIGRRRVDTHVHGLEDLGVQFRYDEQHHCYICTADKVLGKNILLEEPSVTGTANVLMLATLAEGKTQIYNAACEPYLQQLCRLLNAMGAKISGVGSNLLTIEGVQSLHGAKHTLLPDMIEVGSFMSLAAVTDAEIEIENVGLEYLGIIPSVFEKMGLKFSVKGDSILIPNQENISPQNFLDGSIFTISDAPWPGFTPDLLSCALVLACRSNGCVMIHQKMFESRLFFVDKLIEMGAQIVLCDPHRACVIGQGKSTYLRGITMSSPDIRAGVALLLAALSAKGRSEIQHVEQIERGYENIVERLSNLGANIKYVNS